MATQYDTLDIDFLNAKGRDFEELDSVITHIAEEVDLSEIDGNLSVISAISDFEGFDQFERSLSSHFTLEQESGNLYLLNATKLDVPYYVYFDDPEFPIFLTTGRKTEDIPETLDEYILGEQEIGRLWISKTEMENLRQRIVDQYPEVIMPYFTARRSRHAEIDARRRPRHERTIQYYGKDGLETFDEMKFEYGVLPTNLKFQKANEFKFRVTTRGVFTIKHGGLADVLEVIENSIERLRRVKDAIDESGYSYVTNEFSQHQQTIPQSRPWAVTLSEPLTQHDIDRFRGEELEEWEFTLTDIDSTVAEDESYVRAELKDERTRAKSMLRSHNGSIRIYPREHTGIDQSIRVFEFINDQIDPDSYATPVS